MSSPPFFSRWFASTPPPVAVEITSRRVNAVALNAHGANRTVTGYSSEPLRQGLVTPALNAPNIHDSAALAAAVKTAARKKSMPICSLSDRN